MQPETVIESVEKPGNAPENHFRFAAATEMLYGIDCARLGIFETRDQ